MKVLQINSVCGVGSTGRIATDLYKVLENQGYKCKIAYGRGTAPEGIDSIKIGSDFDIYFHVFKSRIFDKHGFGSVNATKKLIEEINRYDPDIIHLHNIHGYYINMELLFNYLKESNKPIVWTLHDCWALTGHCAHFDFIRCERWKTQCYNCPQQKEYPASILSDNSKKNYKIKKDLFTSLKNLYIVTPSNWLMGVVKNSYLDSYSELVINNGIDLEKFTPSKSNFRDRYGIDNEFIILGVSNHWTKKKGIEYFEKLSDILESCYKIVLVGNCESDYIKSKSNIVHIDMTNDISELVEIYSEADIFINPTLEEVMGLVNIEAMACGTPVITFDTGGSTECIDYSTGISVEKGNIEKLVEAIEHIKHDKRLGKVSNSCRERVSKLYDKNIKYKQYIDLYKKILANR